MNHILFMQITKIFFFIYYFIKFGLNFIQFNHIKKNQNIIPIELQENIKLEDHQKAASYSMHKLKFSIINDLFSAFIIYILLFNNGLNLFTNFSENLSVQLAFLSPSLIVIISFSIFSYLTSLPFNIYSIFVIEEKFGFNQTTLKTFILDQLKGLLLSLIIGLPFIYTILWFIKSFSENWWLYTFIFIFSFQLLMLFLFPRFLAPLFNKFTPISDQSLIDSIKELSKKCEISFKDYFIMDASKRSSHGNAYFTGIGKNKRIVLFDTLLSHLTQKELVAVLSHELGHLKLKHILKSIIISSITTIIGLYIIFYLSKTNYFYKAFSIDLPNNGIMLLIFSLISSFFTFPLTPLTSYFSRKNEFEADNFAVNLNFGPDLITGLLKLMKENASFSFPHKWYSIFYYSHPPIIERIKFIKSQAKIS